MWLRIFTAGYVILASGGLAVCAAQDRYSNAAQTPPAPIVTATRQNAFTIPFRVDPPQTPEQRPVEVQLHVSTDRGANWALSSRVRPDKESFVFRAPHDGEYWYSIRTVDAQGITRPDGPLEPQLKVTVDTVAPRLDVTVARGPAGEIVARWQAVDPNLKQGSFKLEYQSTSTGPWEPVAVESPANAMRHTLSGEATWWPTGGSGTILVRAEVSDQAGNPAVTQAVVKPSGAPPAAVTAATPDPEGWHANDPPAEPGEQTRWPPDRNTVDTPAGTANRTSPTTNYSASAPAGFPQSRAPRRDKSAKTARPGPARSWTFRCCRRPCGRGWSLRPTLNWNTRSSRSAPRAWAKSNCGARATADAPGATTPSTPTTAAPWRSHVDGEGIYGFRMLVQSGSGYGGRPPAEGDLPDIWIGVDLTKPACRITSTEVSPDASELVIGWEASDEVLAARPMTLLFAESTNGPWTPIASGLENTGSYHWRLDSRVPDRIVLRLEVRDEAGNVGTYDTPNAVGLDRHRPEGHIRGVRPITNSRPRSSSIRVPRLAGPAVPRPPSADVLLRWRIGFVSPGGLLPPKCHAGQPLVGFDIFVPGLGHDVVGQLGRRTVLVPVGRFQPVAHELLVERRLGAAGMIRVGRPEP